MADKLLKQVTDKLGLDEGQAKQALGALLSFCKNQSGSFDFDGLMKKIPGMDEVMTDAQASKDVPTDAGAVPSFTIVGIITYVIKTFGLMEIVKSLVSTYLGANAVKMLESGSGGAELLGIMNKLGVSQGQGATMVKMLIDFVKQKAGADTVDDLVKHVPVLQAIMDEDKKDE